MTITTAATQLIYPMAAYAFYMFVFAFYLFYTRLAAIRSGELHIKYFRALSGAEPSERVLVVARHYDNQFQVPILFFVTCTLLIALGAASTVTAALAWLFVVSRAAHAFVQLGRNNVTHRVVAFAVGWIVVFVLWIQILLFATGILL